MEESEGYPFVFQMIDRDSADELLTLDMDAYAEKFGNKAVRKNLTIPAWLNTFAEQNHVNFSKILTDALTALYQQVH